MVRPVLLAVFAVTATPVAADPMIWPADGTPDREVAFHCAAVMTALGEAYVFATELLERDDLPRPATLPARLLDAAGGETRISEILDTVLGWRTYWESMGRTSFYASISQDGTPYVADEGEILYENVTRCIARFDL
ncbi:hypothetical protein HKCCE3408_16815 [Rhodobacterales bacterium HKCCE3408]|nr:hypothetical protein [Rhodobacterales bacterium HKCCE3408]